MRTDRSNLMRKTLLGTLATALIATLSGCASGEKQAPTPAQEKHVEKVIEQNEWRTNRATSR